LQFQEEKLIGSMNEVIKEDFSAITTDLNFLAKQFEFIWRTEKDSVNRIEYLTEILLLFSKSKEKYSQIRFITDTGMETVRVDYFKDKSSIIDKTNLQNIKKHYYFSRAFELEKGQMYISPLDLNKIGEKIEVPRKPMIRFGIPVFNDNYDKIGIILLNYLGDNLLDKFRKLNESSSGKILLTNTQGFFFISQDSNDEWGFMYNGKKNKMFSNTYKGTWGKIDSAEKGNFRNDYGLFSFITFYPLIKEQTSDYGIGKIILRGGKQISGKDRYWKVISSLSEKELNSIIFLTFRIWFEMIIVSFVVVSILLWYLARNIQLRRIANKAVRQQNIEIQNQNDEIRANIDELHAINEALVESEERFKAISDTSPVGLIVSNAKGENTYSNKMNETISGLSFQECLKDGWKKVIHPDDIKIVNDQHRALKNKDTMSVESQYRYINAKTGNIVWVYVKISKMIYNEALLGYVGAIEDITETKKAQVALHRSELNLQAMIDSSIQIYFLIDKKYKIVKFNSKAIEHIKALWNKKLQIGDDFLQYSTHSNIQNFVELFRRTLEGERIITERQIVFPSNISYYFNIKYLPVIDKNQEIFGVSLTLEDISQHKFAEEALKRSEQTLKIQNEELEKRNNNILASINYARTIQSALLPAKNLFTEYLSQHFIIYKPKDIVSGDFYWMRKIDDYIIITAADCTGHGVPGAMMSMLGMAFLNEIVRKQDIYHPNLLLDRIREKVKSSLKQTYADGKTKAGIDLALCVIDTKNKILNYAGANINLHIVRDEILSVTKADPMPIGIYKRERPFSNHIIQLEKDDTIYLFSDGYADQIGGERNRKFMIRSLRNLLVEISPLPLPEQKNILLETFINWKGNFNQLDDILVIGFKPLLNNG
jgi:PAS domain S-box-containing protein